MRQEIVEYLPWGLSALSLVNSWMNGNRWRNVWLFGLFIQCLWLLWVLASGLWGFMPLTASLFFVYARNHLKWRREEAEAQAKAFCDAVLVRNAVRCPACDGEGGWYGHGCDRCAGSGKVAAEETEYRKELWKDGRLIASVAMSPVADARREEPNYLQECRRGPSPWLTDAEVSNMMWASEGLEPLQAPPVFNKHGHEAHCSLMFPATIGTEDDHCDCRADHDYPACGVFRGGKCSCDSSDRPNPTKET